jgi:hypothetical protein
MSAASRHVATGRRRLAGFQVPRRWVVVDEIFEEAASFNARLRDPDGLVLEVSAPTPPGQT